MGPIVKHFWNWDQNTYLESLVRYLAFGLEYVVYLKLLMRYLRGLGTEASNGISQGFGPE